MNEVASAYQLGGEIGRMTAERNGVEWQRTCELLSRWLPSPPAAVADVGAGPGEYAKWLGDKGFEVHVFDVTPLHVQYARKRGLKAELADAREIPAPAEAYDAILLMGPLYHLQAASDRRQALAEAYRIVKPGGVIVAGALSRWARPLVRAAAGQLAEPAWHQHTLLSIRDGQVDDGTAWGKIAYLHDVNELAGELAEAGFADVAVLGVEGPVGPWARLDPALNDHAIELAQAAEEALAACSIHMLGKGIKPVTRTAMTARDGRVVPSGCRFRSPRLNAEPMTSASAIGGNNSNSAAVVNGCPRLRSNLMMVGPIRYDWVAGRFGAVAAEEL